LCKIPCKRITGGTPTRKCRSAAPSATTNCSRSDIEYDILTLPYRNRKKRTSELIHIAHRGSNHFVGSGQARQDLARAILSQSAHAHLPGAGAQNGGGN